VKTRNIAVLSFFLAVASFFGGRQAGKFLNVPQPPVVRFPVQRFEIMVVTAYDPWDKCVGKFAEKNKKDPILRKKWSGPGVASANKLLPLGTRLWIPTIDYRGRVDDNGGAMREDARQGIYHIDLRLQSHLKALRFGRHILVVFVSPKKRAQG